MGLETCNLLRFGIYFDNFFVFKISKLLPFYIRIMSEFLGVFKNSLIRSEIPSEKL